MQRWLLSCFGRLHYVKYKDVSDKGEPELLYKSMAELGEETNGSPGASGQYGTLSVKSCLKSTTDSRRLSKEGLISKGGISRRHVHFSDRVIVVDMEKIMPLHGEQHHYVIM